MKAVEVDDLWQSYRARRLEHARTIKGALASVGRKKMVRRWALKGVSLDVEAGEMLGVIGSNGSGKSTLLRCLAGIYRPVKGTVTVRGRSASLIDLTAGFERDLSARDNVLLAGAIYGVPRNLLKERFEEIIDFAELRDEADSPLRVYSTGMAMRLGFSLAVSLEPDLLLVDEVLAVGDEAFRMRCLDKVRSLRESGTTVVFVSHELSLVRWLCDRTIVLKAGTVFFDGDTQDAIETYCKDIGVDLDAALTRTTVEPSTVERAERAWTRRR